MRPAGPTAVHAVLYTRCTELYCCNCCTLGCKWLCLGGPYNCMTCYLRYLRNLPTHIDCCPAPSVPAHVCPTDHVSRTPTACHPTMSKGSVAVYPTAALKQGLPKTQIVPPATLNLIPTPTARHPDPPRCRRHRQLPAPPPAAPPPQRATPPACTAAPDPAPGPCHLQSHGTPCAAAAAAAGVGAQ